MRLGLSCGWNRGLGLCLPGRLRCGGFPRPRILPPTVATDDGEGVHREGAELA